jgi:hypothetical protein
MLVFQGYISAPEGKPYDPLVFFHSLWPEHTLFKNSISSLNLATASIAILNDQGVMTF